MEKMNLEQLDSDLLLNIFEYLSVAHLLHAFQDLNSRLDNYLLIHLRTRRHLNFQSSSKRNLHLFCREYLPLMNTKPISLYLSNDDDSPQQIQLFLSYQHAVHQLLYLQSITLHQLSSIKDYATII